MILTHNIAHNIPFISIFLAMFAGIITPLVNDGKKSCLIHKLTTIIIGILSVLLLIHVNYNQERFTFLMGHFPSPWGNELKAGPMEAVLAVAFSVVMFLTVMGGQYMIEKDIAEKKQNLYFVMLNLLFGSMLALIYTNDIFTGYVFIEVNTICSCAIIMSKDSGSGILATIRYLIMSILGSGLILFAIALLYTLTGQLLFPQLKSGVLQVIDSGNYMFPMTITAGIFTLGIAVKSALFPFHTMLPGAYDAATPSSSGILSGLVLKSYIIFLIKVYYCVFTIEYLREIKITNLIFFLGVCGMIFGSVMALKERRIRRMLAYSSVAQIGYIYMGLGLGTSIGVTAAMLHIVAHAVTKSMLFVCTGRMKDISLAGEADHCLRGIGYKAPFSAVGFTVGALSIIGIPLFAGFASKLYLAVASFYSPFKMAVALIMLAVSMVLNAMYFIPPVVDIWRPLSEKDANYRIEPDFRPAFITAVVLFIAVNFFVGTCYESIFDIFEVGVALMR